jgi:site-specific recombinase XerD
LESGPHPEAALPAGTAVTRRRGELKRKPAARRAFGNAAKRAGLPEDFRRHDLRHRRVTTLLSEGKSPVLVQAAMGHASFKTTEDYLHLIKDNLRDLIGPKQEQDENGDIGKVNGKVGG